MTQREIKFRAWDGHQMLYGDCIEWTDGVLCFHSSSHSVLEGCPVEPLKGHSAMQYTGLKDKNGKDIYEWDIIKWGVHIGAVEWKVNWYLFADGFGLSPCNQTSEIIGNIYENPELLQPQKNEILWRREK